MRVMERKKLSFAFPYANNENASLGWLAFFSVYLFSQLAVALYETDMLYKSKENYVIIHYAKYFE